jgi:hypothetical protein
MTPDRPPQWFLDEAARQGTPDPVVPSSPGESSASALPIGSGLTAEEIVAVYVGSLRAPDVMHDLIAAGYTVCGPDCECSCLRSEAAAITGLRR